MRRVAHETRRNAARGEHAELNSKWNGDGIPHEPRRSFSVHTRGADLAVKLKLIKF